MSTGESARITGANLHTGARVRHVDVDEWLSAIEDFGASAVIFDCDGTLVHSSDAHLGAMQNAAAAQGFAMAQEWYQQRTLDAVTPLVAALVVPNGLAPGGSAGNAGPYPVVPQGFPESVGVVAAVGDQPVDVASTVLDTPKYQ